MTAGWNATSNANAIVLDVASRRQFCLASPQPAARGLLSLISLLRAFLLNVIKRNQDPPPQPPAVRKAKSAEIEKFERKKTCARAGARHVRWESCQLAAHTRVGRSVVGREDRPPQWGVVHDEHTPISIPVLMNAKLRIRIFTHRPGQGGAGHVHLSKTRQLSLTGRSIIPHPSLQRRKKISAKFSKNARAIFLVCNLCSS